ncbi:MAG: hypothetical protein QM758_08635 [Armatimonas sp.]
MPKLKKRLPESRSEKRERLASEKELRSRDKELARARLAQLKTDAQYRDTLLREWRIAVDNRLLSDEAYVRFEAIHSRDWDLIRPYWLPNVELSLAVQRLIDGRDTDPEPIIAWLETGPSHPATALHLLKRANLSDCQRIKLQALVLHTLARTTPICSFRYWIRLARKLYTPAFHDQVTMLPGERARILLAHLEQERTMRL